MVRYDNPRNAKLTILVPQNVLDDLKALRTATLQSTGDLVNKLIEAELEKQQDLVKEGHEFLKKQELLKDKARERREPKPREDLLRPSEDEIKTRDGSAAADPRKATPTASDIDIWSAQASNKEEESRRKSDLVAFLGWVIENNEPFNRGSATKYHETVLMSKNTPSTANRHRGRINKFITWWNDNN